MSLSILIVSQYFWPETFRISDLALALQKQGHSITVLTGMPTYPNRKNFQGYGKFSPMEESFQGIKILRVPLFSRDSGTNISLVLNYLSFALSATFFGFLRCRSKYDVIFVFQPSPVTSVLPAILLRWIKGIPLILWIQDLWPETLRATGVIRSEKILNFVKKLVRFIYKNCDKILVQAKSAQSSVMSLGVSSEKIHYFPNWAESVYQPKSFNPTLKANLQLPEGFWIMFAGNLGISQSLNTIVQAAQRLQSQPNIQFIIVGEGRQSEWLKEEVHQKKLTNIHMLGRKPIEEMPDLFALADGLLVTLKKDPIFEMVIPSKVQSYLACAKPIVAALDGAGADIILESNCGFVGPTEDAVSLANNILSLYDMSSEQRKVMGQNAYDYYLKNFNRDNLITELNSWMTELTSTPTRDNIGDMFSDQ